MQKTINPVKKRPGRSLIQSNDFLMFGRLPPQATDLEIAVLGAIMLEKKVFDEITGILQSECFYVEAHQKIFSAMLALQGKNSPIDLLTVVEELRYRQELDLVGGPFFVTNLTNCVVSAANVVAHAKIILQKFIQRELIRVSGEILNDAYEDNADVFDQLDAAGEKIMTIGTSNIQSGMITMDVVIMKALQQIEEWRQNDGTLTGVTSGFHELDRATRGWQPGDLIILAARPSVGKTAIALNLIRNAAMMDKKEGTIAIWSLEMKAKFLALRMLAAESNTLLHRIQTGRLDEDQMKHLIKEGALKLAKLNISFDESSHINIRSISSKARRLSKKGKLKMIVIDYIQLMGSIEKSATREREIAIISRDLKNLAQELEIPVIILSQLSREGVKGVTWETGPQMSALRESGSLEQDGDVILMLWGATDSEINQNPDLDGKRKLKIVKQRNGVQLTVQFDFKDEIQLFQSIDTITKSRSVDKSKS